MFIKDFIITQSEEYIKNSQIEGDRSGNELLYTINFIHKNEKTSIKIPPVKIFESFDISPEEEEECNNSEDFDEEYTEHSRIEFVSGSNDYKDFSEFERCHIKFMDKVLGSLIIDRIYYLEDRLNESLEIINNKLRKKISRFENGRTNLSYEEYTEEEDDYDYDLNYFISEELHDRKVIEFCIKKVKIIIETKEMIEDKILENLNKRIDKSNKRYGL